MTGPAPAEGRPTQHRIRPYLSAPTGEGTDPIPEPAPQRARPFILTSGRVEATDPYVGLESQVLARRTGPTGHLAPELRAIIELCHQPLSVAEVSARLRLHLGVTQILIGDLRAAGLVEVHTADINQTLNVDMILRVIRGLRTIS